MSEPWRFSSTGVWISKETNDLDGREAKVFHGYPALH